MCWAWLWSPVIATCGRWRQEDYELPEREPILKKKKESLSESLRTNKQTQEAVWGPFWPSYIEKLLRFLLFLADGGINLRKVREAIVAPDLLSFMESLQGWDGGAHLWHCVQRDQSLGLNPSIVPWTSQSAGELGKKPWKGCPSDRMDAMMGWGQRGKRKPRLPSNMAFS